MSVLVEGKNSYFLADQALLVPEDREIASDWASAHINGNPAIRWILGKYVEADQANNNRQFWALDDLRMAQPSIDHAPMNILHKPRNIVGAYVATEMIYPNATNESASEHQTPYIEALGAFWKYYFPEELAVVEMAHDQGSLFFSMECVADTITFHLPDGESEEFAFAGPQSETYGKFGKDPDAVKQLNNPHFLAGALVIPPERPGWSGARVTELSTMVKAHQEEAEAAYEGIKASAPHLSPQQWEMIMAQVMEQAKSENA